VARTTSSKDGFTLIELLIVIIVLGILATIVLIGVATFKDDANATSCTADATNLHHAAVAYNLKTEDWPSGANGDERVQALVDAGLIEKAPTTGATLVDNQGHAGGC
jgi:general secretion pathway protein G